MIYYINPHWKCTQMMQSWNRILAMKEQAQKLTMWMKIFTHTTSPKPDTGMILGALLTWLSWPCFFLFHHSPPLFLFFCFYSIWFKTVLLGIRLREKRLQESSLALQMLYPWTNYTMKSCFWGPPKRSQGFVEVGNPAVQYKLCIC